jgi:hypothetical protein
MYSTQRQSKTGGCFTQWTAMQAMEATDMCKNIRELSAVDEHQALQLIAVLPAMLALIGAAAGAVKWLMSPPG